MSTAGKILSILFVVPLALSCSKKKTVETESLPKQQSVEKTAQTPSTPLPVEPDQTPKKTTEPTTPREAVRKRFTELFGDLRHPSVTPDKLKAAWSEFWTEEFNYALPSAADTKVASGLELPKELSQLTKAEQPLYVQIESGRISIAPDAQESAIAIYTICVGACSSGGRDLPTLLLNRAKTLPPTQGDLVVFEILQETLPMVDQQAPMTANQASGWVALANAPNPIYRLAALQGFARVSVDREQRLAFYGQYKDESDATILKVLIDSVESLPSADAPAMLADVQAMTKKAGQTEVSEYAAKAFSRRQASP